VVFKIDLEPGQPGGLGASYALLRDDVPATASEITFAIGPLPLTVGQFGFSFAMGCQTLLISTIGTMGFFEINESDFSGWAIITN